MSYRVNGKNLSIGRLMVRGKEADKRLKYIHVSPKGTTVVTPVVIARVSLPKEDVSSRFAGHVVIPQNELDELRTAASPTNDTLVDLPEGVPAVTGPQFLVPQIEKCFPDPEYQTGVFTCNGDILRRLLTAACEVSNDSDKTIRLRICNDLNSLRIDTYRQPGDQEFCGVIKGLEYDGEYIPGEKTTSGQKVERKPQQRGMMLKVAAGRKFRGEGE
jgi:hypothetical protein